LKWFTRDSPRLRSGQALAPLVKARDFGMAPLKARAKLTTTDDGLTMVSRLGRVKIKIMRYLVRARVKGGCERALLRAIEEGTLGQGSVAEGEYLRNMRAARLCQDDTARWVEVCYCPTPLQEEREYWEQYFELTRVQDAHDRRNCRDQNGSEAWACGGCDCTERLERKLEASGKPFLESLRNCLMRLPSQAAPEKY